MMIDPRVSVIRKRLSNIKRVIPVVSGKGGVGKTLVSAVSSLILAEMKYSVGLLDLDFHGPSCHIILGVKDAFPVEEKGLIPPDFHGVRFMSLYYFIKDEPVPLRGKDISDAIIELLAITRWGSLDYLIIDMPPGTGDEILDVIRFINGEYLIVSTPSLLSLSTVSRLIKILKHYQVRILGLIENMYHKATNLLEKFSEANKIPYLGKIPYDYNVEEKIGDPKELLKTTFADNLREIIERIK